MTATGQHIVTLALTHKDEDYVLGAIARLDKPHRGPWDCSLFASKMLYDVSGIIYGCVGIDPTNPKYADPYTGAWAQDARKRGHIIEVNDAARTPGAFVLRVGQRIGHIAICQGDGRTIEAKGAAYGVCEDEVGNRRWDYGICVPGIQYNLGPFLPTPAPGKIYRLTTPYMKCPEVKEIQIALLRAGFSVGGHDGVYGPRTANAVLKFQKLKGLVVDGEVGPQTLKALGVSQ